LVKKGREEALMPSSAVCFTMEVMLAVQNLCAKINCFAEIL